MRRTWIVLAGIGALALVVVLTVNAMAQDPGTSTAKPARTITVSSTATVKATPDEAVVGFGVTAQDAGSAAAFAQNAKDMQAVLDALNASGIAEKDIKTLNVGLSRRTVDRGKPTEHTVFVASNSIEVTVHDLSAVGSVIDAAVGAGADSVKGVRFQLSNPDTIRTDALTQAVEGAREKADALAAAAGTQVVRVVTIDEETYRQPAYASPVAGFALQQAALSAAPTPVVAPDSLQASVTVSVVWEIG
ncbi:MAG: SIMPL domain-containing protein [Planctomycetaceae bacterium]